MFVILRIAWYGCRLATQCSTYRMCAFFIYLFCGWCFDCCLVHTKISRCVHFFCRTGYSVHLDKKKKKKKTLLLSPSSTKWLASPSSIRGCVLATQGVFLVCFMRRPIDIYCLVRAFVNSFSVPGYKWLSAFVNASCQQLSNFTSILAPKQFSAGGFSLSKPAVSGSTCLTVEVCPSFYFSFY